MHARDDQEWCSLGCTVLTVDPEVEDTTSDTSNWVTQYSEWYETDDTDRDAQKSARRPS